MEYSRRPTKSTPKENQLKVLNRIYQTYLVSTTHVMYCCHETTLTSGGLPLNTWWERVSSLKCPVTREGLFCMTWKCSIPLRGLQFVIYRRFTVLTLSHRPFANCIWSIWNMPKHVSFCKWPPGNISNAPSLSLPFMRRLWPSFRQKYLCWIDLPLWRQSKRR